MNWVLFRRRLIDRLAYVCAALATVLGLIFLFWILWTTIANGISAISPKLFTEMTPPPGAEGGLLNALYGSAVMIALAIVVGTPIGLCAGTYLAEHGRHTRLASAVRFVNDILLSAPSIVLGLFIYELIVVPMKHFSGLSGGLALGLILIPVIVRTSDEALRLVPDRMREAAFALGLPRWKVSLQVLYKAAMSGIVTGALLGVARISGETAPLLFTALSNQFWSSDLNGPLANLPVVIFQYAMSPYDTWHALAWAGALILTTFVLALNLVVRLFANRRVFK